jgi:hypothetical protein
LASPFAAAGRAFAESGADRAGAVTELAHRRFARPEDIGLSRGDFAILARLRSPQRIQSFLNRVSVNHEVGGETTLSVQQVLLQRRAHCIEAAFVAACALWVQGKRPLLMYLDCDPCDCPHVVALFKSNGCWGAISKSRGEGLSYRDPVYRSLRELAMSWFHEYLDDRGRRTLREYSVAFDMRRLAPSLWVTSTEPCDEAQERLARLRRYPLISRRQEKLVLRRIG